MTVAARARARGKRGQAAAAAASNEGLAARPAARLAVGVHVGVRADGRRGVQQAVGSHHEQAQQLQVQMRMLGQTQRQMWMQPLRQERGQKQMQKQAQEQKQLHEQVQALVHRRQRHSTAYSALAPCARWC